MCCVNLFSAVYCSLALSWMNFQYSFPDSEYVENVKNYPCKIKEYGGDLFHRLYKAFLCM